MRRAICIAVTLAVIAGGISGCNIVFPERTFSVSPNEVVCSRGEGKVEIDKEILPGISGNTFEDNAAINFSIPSEFSAENIKTILLACKKFVGWP